jgi:peptide/nickel transport system substrate-binding protein
MAFQKRTGFLRAAAMAAAIGLAALAPSAVLAQPQGELRVASPFALTVMDIEGAQSGDRLVLTINRNLYDGLTWFNDETGKLEPNLATSWEATDSGWIFHLRDDVKFHDGEPFTANDVKATVEKVLAAKGPMAPILEGVEEVVAVDDHTVEFRTAHPLGPLPNNLALLGIAPAKLIGNADYHSHPIGTGPFQFDSFSPGQELVLTANTDYWKGAPGVEKLVFVDIPEPTTRVTALETGEIDLTWTFPSTSYERLKNNDALTVETVPSFINYEFLFNWDRPPLDDPRVREALAISINADALFTGLLGPLSAASTAPLPPTVFGYANIGAWKYDPERAKQLLQEAGVEPGDLKLTLLGRNQKVENDVGLAMISDWAKIGITVEPKYLELATWAKSYVAKDFDLSLITKPTNTGDADWTLGRLYLSSSNRVPCANEELDGYILGGRQSTDPAVRQAAYEKALRYIFDNLCGFYPRDVLEPYAWSKKVHGFVPSAATIPSFAKVTIDEN